MTHISRDIAEFTANCQPTSIDAQARSVVGYRCGRILASLADPAASSLNGALPSIMVELSGSGPTELAMALAHAGVRESSVTYAARAAGTLRSAGLVPVPTDPLVEVPALAAAVALGAERRTSGARLLDAVVIGVEVGLRLETALAEHLLRRGWQAGAVAGRIGATAAAARLMELTTEQALVALGVAATQIAGLQCANDTAAGRLAVAKQAGDGVEAVLLARAGFTAPADPIGGRRGLAAVAAGYPGSLPNIATHQNGRWSAAGLPAAADPRWAELAGAEGVWDLDAVDDASELTSPGTSALR